MEHYCEFEVGTGRMVHHEDGGPDNLPYSEAEHIVCGKPARFKYEADGSWWMWVCAEHWDYIHDGEGSFKVPESTFGRGNKTVGMTAI
jgi:hypothetical protein